HKRVNRSSPEQNRHDSCIDACPRRTIGASLCVKLRFADAPVAALFPFVGRCGRSLLARLLVSRSYLNTLRYCDVLSDLCCDLAFHFRNKLRKHFSLRLVLVPATTVEQEPALHFQKFCRAPLFQPNRSPPVKGFECRRGSDKQTDGSRRSAYPGV